MSEREGYKLKDVPVVLARQEAKIADLEAELAAERRDREGVERELRRAIKEREIVDSELAAEREGNAELLRLVAALVAALEEIELLGTIERRGSRIARRALAAVRQASGQEV